MISLKSSLKAGAGAKRHLLFSPLLSRHPPILRIQASRQLPRTCLIFLEGKLDSSATFGSCWWSEAFVPPHPLFLSHLLWSPKYRLAGFQFHVSIGENTINIHDLRKWKEIETKSKSSKEAVDRDQNSYKVPHCLTEYICWLGRRFVQHSKPQFSCNSESFQISSYSTICKPATQHTARAHALIPIHFQGVPQISMSAVSLPSCSSPWSFILSIKMPY